MSFDQRLEPDLINLLQAGASITLSSTARQHDSLMRLAEAARQGGGQLRLTSISSRMPHDLVLIAKAGRGHIIFE